MWFPICWCSKKVNPANSLLPSISNQYKHRREEFQDIRNSFWYLIPEGLGQAWEVDPCRLQEVQQSQVRINKSTCGLGQSQAQIWFGKTMAWEQSRGKGFGSASWWKIQDERFFTLDRVRNQIKCLSSCGDDDNNKNILIIMTRLKIKVDFSKQYYLLFYLLANLNQIMLAIVSESFTF